MASQFIFDAIGTRWQIDISDSLSEEQEIELLEKIRERIRVFDEAYSRFRPDSLVTKMSLEAGEYVLPADAEDLFSIYRAFYDITGGLFTPLIGQVLVDAGYDATYTLKQKKALEQPLPWEEVMIYEHPRLMLKKPALLDFGAAGKGYLIDLVGEVLEENSVQNYSIDAGGDILQRNSANASLRIGLEHPINLDQVVGIAAISNQSICGSAGNRRAWGDFHHIIDPVKLASPRHILAVWAVASTTLLADALTTGLFFVSPQTLEEHFDFEYFIVYSDLSIEKSPRFPLVENWYT